MDEIHAQEWNECGHMYSTEQFVNFGVQAKFDDFKPDKLFKIGNNVIKFLLSSLKVTNKQWHSLYAHGAETKVTGQTCYAPGDKRILQRFKSQTLEGTGTAPVTLTRKVNK